MKVREVIDQGGPFCAPDEPLQQAAERMCLWGYDVLPVCLADRRLVGSVTSRSVCLQACMTGRSLGDVRVRDATSEQPLCVRAEEGVRTAMHLMVRERVWQIPVTDAGGFLLGMVTYDRLLREISGERDLMVVVREVNALDEIRGDYDFMTAWTLVTRTRELIAPEGGVTQLSRAEARLLLVLAEHAGCVLDRDALTRSVVQRSWHPTDRYVDVLVAHLRKKFGERGADARMIRTVPNDGYVLTLKVVDERGRTAGDRSASATGPQRAERVEDSRASGGESAVSLPGI